MSTSFWSALIAPLIYLVLFSLCSRDIRILDLAAGRGRCTPRTRNKPFLAHQLLRAMTMLNVVEKSWDLDESVARTANVDPHPYLRHVADTVSVSKAARPSVIKLDGLFFQTEDQAELNMRPQCRTR